MGLNQTKICNSTIGKEAAKYYYDNRHQIKIEKRQIEKVLQKYVGTETTKSVAAPAA